MFKKISEIKADKNQPRKTFDEDKLKFLAESILGNGLLTPIDIDENNLLIDGERRFKAHKIAGLKEIECRIINLKGNGNKRLRRQLISDIQDEGIPMEEKEKSIIKLWKSECPNQTPQSAMSANWCKELGISVRALRRAKDNCIFIEEEPEIAKEVSPSIIAETAHMEKEERKEILKEFIGTKNKKQSLIKELVRDKKEKIQMQKALEEIKKTKDYSIKITRTEEQLSDLKEKISNEIHRIGKLMFYIGKVRRTKLYLEKPKAKESFFKFIDGSIDRVEKWVQDLRNLKENLEFEIIKE